MSIFLHSLALGTALYKRKCSVTSELRAWQETRRNFKNISEWKKREQWCRSRGTWLCQMGFSWSDNSNFKFSWVPNCHYLNWHVLEPSGVGTKTITQTRRATAPHDTSIVISRDTRGSLPRNSPPNWLVFPKLKNLSNQECAAVLGPTTGPPFLDCIIIVCRTVGLISALEETYDMAYSACVCIILVYILDE